MCTLASASTMQKTIAEEFSYSAGPTVVSYLDSVLCCVLHAVGILLLHNVLRIGKGISKFPMWTSTLR